MTILISVYCVCCSVVVFTDLVFSAVLDLDPLFPESVERLNFVGCGDWCHVLFKDNYATSM